MEGKGGSRHGLGSISDSILITKHLARATGTPQTKDIWWKIFDSHQNGPAFTPELLSHWLGTIFTKLDLDRNALVNPKKKKRKRGTMNQTFSLEREMCDPFSWFPQITRSL